MNPKEKQKCKSILHKAGFSGGLKLACGDCGKQFKPKAPDEQKCKCYCHFNLEEKVKYDCAIEGIICKECKKPCFSPQPLGEEWEAKLELQIQMILEMRFGDGTGQNLQIRLAEKEIKSLLLQERKKANK